MRRPGWHAGLAIRQLNGTLPSPGETTKTIDVLIGDLIDELPIDGTCNLSGAVNAGLTDAQGVGNILDDDTATISVSDATVTEGNSGT